MRLKRFFILLSFFSVLQIAKPVDFGVAADIGYSYKFINKPISQLYLGAIAAYSKGNRSYIHMISSFSLAQVLIMENIMVKSL